MAAHAAGAGAASAPEHGDGAVRDGDPRPATRPAPPSPFDTGTVVVREVGPFVIGDGTALPELRVAYRHDGPGPGEAPQVLVVHALTGSADAAGDWWAPLIGPGRLRDDRADEP
jgi:homoserine acetyltransferase